MYLESQGHASKSKIEDYLKETKGTTGDCASRRMRELVAGGTIRKDQKEYEGKKYWDYSVVEPTELELDEYKHIDCFDCGTDPISLSEQKLNL